MDFSVYSHYEDGKMQTAGVIHRDSNAVLYDTWQEWNIDLKDFVGVNLQVIKKMIIGVGSRIKPPGY